MLPYYQKSFSVPSFATDRYNRLKPSYLLGLAQEVAGDHSALLKADFAHTQLYWVITRQQVQISRLPTSGETITLETWPMPTTRVAYPRSTIAYDEHGNELFRSISLWVLMDPQSRAMVLPGRSGVEVAGLLTGNELAAPGSILPRAGENTVLRTVRFSELDRNGHMNNTRYLDWAADLLTAGFHKTHPVKEFTVCYLSEAVEKQQIELTYGMDENGIFQVDGSAAQTDDSDKKTRIFSVKVQF